MNKTIENILYLLDLAIEEKITVTALYNNICDLQTIREIKDWKSMEFNDVYYDLMYLLERYDPNYENLKGVKKFIRSFKYHGKNIVYRHLQEYRKEFQDLYNLQIKENDHEKLEKTQ